MNILDIINTQDHRPWPLPNSPWKFYQEWNDVIFLHWQVDLQDLRPFVPKSLEIDLYEGKPWVSVVAFTMDHIRPRNLPAFPPVSTFYEVNIRTYVKVNNTTGVYFLSIEACKRVSCFIARTMSALPYRHSKINRSASTLLSTNATFNDTLEIAFNVKQEITNKTAIDNWLTERYALMQDEKSTLNQFDIHHLEWPLHQIDISHLNINYDRYGALLKGRPNQTHYSKGVQVLAWGKQKL